MPSLWLGTISTPPGGHSGIPPLPKLDYSDQNIAYKFSYDSKPAESVCVGLGVCMSMPLFTIAIRVGRGLLRVQSGLMKTLNVGLCTSGRKVRAAR